MNACEFTAPRTAYVPAGARTPAMVTGRTPSVIDMQVICGGFRSPIVTVFPTTVNGLDSRRTRTWSFDRRKAAGSRTTTGPRPGCPQTIS